MSSQPPSPWPQAHPVHRPGLLPAQAEAVQWILDLVLETSGKKVCPVLHPCSWCGDSVSSCPWGSTPHVGLQAGPWPQKGRGVPRESEESYMGRSSGVTTSTQVLPLASTLASSGCVPLREEEPTYCPLTGPHRPSLHNKVTGNLPAWLTFEARSDVCLFQMLPAHKVLTSRGGTPDPATPSI